MWPLGYLQDLSVIWRSDLVFDPKQTSFEPDMDFI